MLTIGTALAKTAGNIIYQLFYFGGHTVNTGFNLFTVRIFIVTLSLGTCASVFAQSGINWNVYDGNIHPVAAGSVVLNTNVGGTTEFINVLQQPAGSDFFFANGDGTISLDTTTESSNRHLVQIDNIVNNTGSYPKTFTFISGISGNLDNLRALELEMAFGDLGVDAGKIRPIIYSSGVQRIQLLTFDGSNASVDYRFNTTGFNIYHISVNLTAPRTGTVEVYVNGVMRISSTANGNLLSAGDGANYLRLGDSFNTAAAYKSTVDWMVWTDEGAFTPAQATGMLPNGLGNIGDYGDNGNVPDSQEERIAELEATVNSLQAVVASMQAYINDLQQYVSVGTDNQNNPAVFFTGANVHVRNGQGETVSTTMSPNGLGNLIIGYDEPFVSPTPKTGSHNLVVGDFHSYTNYAGVVFGRRNAITARFASVKGGTQNTASNEFSSVDGGALNTASGSGASILGGAGNTASGSSSTVSGGSTNTATGDLSSITGGLDNATNNALDMVAGGYNNVASGGTSVVSGGSGNAALGTSSTVSGGENRTVTGVNDWAGGGLLQDF